MSSGTYVKGSITVDSYCDTNEKGLYRVQTVVNHLPRVYGSEQDMHVLIQRMPGPGSMFSSHDDMGRASNLHEYGEMFGAESQYILTLSGHLRDTTFDETFKNMVNFLTRLATRLCIEDMSVNISDGGDQSYTFGEKEAEKFGDMYDPDYANAWFYAYFLGPRVMNNLGIVQDVLRKTGVYRHGCAYDEARRLDMRRVKDQDPDTF